jgi:hypothetical protein
MLNPILTSEDTPPEYRPAIRHRGPCGPRRPCWRPACRDRFGIYPSVEMTADGWLAYCHGTTGPRHDQLLNRATA